MPITYPRPCPTCGKKYKNIFDFSRHRKYCGTNVKVPCLHCDKMFSRKDAMKVHVKMFHSESARRKAANNDELLRMELLHSSKVPCLSLDNQTGGAVSTRSMKQDSKKADLKPAKDEPRTNKRKMEEDIDMLDLMDDGLDEFLVERANRLALEKKPLFKANVVFLPYQRQGLKGAVEKEQFSVTFDQLRPPTEAETLGEGLSEALFTTIRDTILQQKLPNTTQVHLNIERT